MMAKRALVIQLARLGDLVQTIPAIAALKEAHADWILDLLCPAHLEEIGRILPGIAAVVLWDGTEWHRRALQAEKEFRPELIVEADAHLHSIAKEPYDYACVLNQHPRAILAGALLARHSIGTMTGGPLEQKLSPWATYVRGVASDRRENRIHLADAFCGMCGVPPPKAMIPMQVPSAPLPLDLDAIRQSDGTWIGLVVGAGDQERLVPVSVWVRLVVDCLQTFQQSRIVLLGSKQEQERAYGIQTALSPSLLGRVWDTTGRLSLSELALALTRCQVVIGADTGPLHLAAAVGTKVIGWYFARARVHETGPYGSQDWVWQAEGDEGHAQRLIIPHRWPIDETIALLSNRPVATNRDWSLWESHRDRWGAYYVQAGHEVIAPSQREQIWQELHSTPVG
ncbi:MAG: glycosyltransferase family 9 protein [Nitrospira sp.]|nr:glycosyltransferase family 9 protein [Nitrospira sp.]MDH4302533.1 glycosyltransferase family 9 protein [Nitrospira sp.]MDH5193342.1 glycosyltransferase family 9 protein [Nitrospira sp.]